MGTVTTLSGDIGLTYDVNGELSASDASAFWARLPEKVSIALVKAAPKVAGPWKSYGSFTFRPWLSDSDEYAAEVYGGPGDVKWASEPMALVRTADSYEAGMTAADKQLRGAGVLVDDGPGDLIRKAETAGLSVAVTELGGGK